MSSTVYFNPRYSCPVDVEDAYKELERIRSEHDGVLNPADVVSESEAETAPLHRVFTWDDKMAASKYRVGEAKTLIRNIVVDAPEIGARIRKYHAIEMIVEEKKAFRYKDTREILTEAELRQQLLNNAVSEITAWKKKYNDFKELIRVYKEIDNLTKG